LKYIEEKIAKLDIATANIAPETFEDKAYNWVMMAATGESRRLIAPLKIDKCQRLNYAMFSNRGLFSGMYAVEAERGSCKTSFAINIMIAVALHFRAAKEEKSKILFYSLDDNFSDYMEKFLALTMGIRRDIYRRKLKTEEIQNVSNAVFEKMAGLGIEVIEQKDLTKNASGAMEYSLIEKDVERRRQRGEKIEMVVIDYLQKLTMGDSGRGRSEAYEYQHIINSMKNKIQQVNDCALIILSQRTQLDDNVSEKHRNKINKSSQSRGRGYRGLPDAVDVSVALINRNSMDVSLNNQNDEVHYIDLYISKNKIVSAGLGYVPLMFYRYYCKFEEIEVMKNV
jgi:replicative DNA helicase